MGNGDQQLYVEFQAGDDAYDNFGITHVGAFSSESMFIHFVDDQSMRDWRTSPRSIAFTATDEDFHEWEGGFNLNTENEDLYDGSYAYAVRDLAADPSTDGYDDVVLDDSQDTDAVNDYAPVNTIDFIEYSMNNMGLRTELASELTSYIESAGVGGVAVNIVMV